MENQISPEIYELAFSYRDYEAEVDFLELCFQEYSETENSRVLDIACGVGEHLREFCQRGYVIDGFDLDPEAVEYAKLKSTEEGLPFSVWGGDMRDFQVKEQYGLAINMLTAANLLLSNEDMIAHLRAVAKALDPGGIYILEMAHPREYGSPSNIPTYAWEIQRDDLYLECDLRHKTDPLDSIAQTQRYNIRVNVTEGEEVKTYYLERTYRVYLYQEFKALIECSGSFEWVSCFGSFHQNRHLDASQRSWRMIPVLRRSR